MAIAFAKEQRKGGVKVINVEGGREKEKEVIFHATGTRMMMSKKEKKN